MSLVKKKVSSGAWGLVFSFFFNLLQVNRRSSVFSVQFESRDEGPNEAVGSGVLL